jgi:hypothetical protein
MQTSDIIGSVGVALLLLAFLLNLSNQLKQDSKLYTLMNIAGAGLACYASWLIGFIPFVVLEGTWFLVAAIAFIRLLRS